MRHAVSKLPAVRPGEIQLACPACRTVLEESGGESWCPQCRRLFPRLAGGRRDFRLRDGDVLTSERSYSPASHARARRTPVRLERPLVPRRNQLTDAIPVHLTDAQVSYLPTGGPGQVALDLGCGHGLQRSVLDRLGYTCYAVDYEGAGADDLVDAHALPVCEANIDLVLSIAVLEHLADPSRAVSEVFRVLKPGGRFVGTVAFLEPFHDESFFHFTHRGLTYVLQNAGFEIEVVSPIARWNVWRAQIEMGMGSGSRFSRALAWLASAPFTLGLELYGALGRRFARHAERYDRSVMHARHAGAFFFVAQRPSSAACQGSGGRANEGSAA
jgi:SAM-dependent methyltransferase